MHEIEKTYEPQKIEDKLYKKWEQNGYFKATIDPDKTPYTIVIPPPNITGQLHMGHALDNTMQDILIRWKRMDGYAALWVPGTDHASIATEAKIVDDMAKEGLKKEDITREEFLDRAWKWKRKYGDIIVNQLRKLGSSCDWSRERFTMDEGLSDAVLEVFIKLYNKGLIYRGERISNWCPKCGTSISDIEVEYEEKDGSFWHLKYPFSDGSGYLIVATTRPETMLGDTAVAVNPDDERYTDIIGKTIDLPIVNRKIPVIADSYVEKEFGTGCVKITPAHDPNDFEIGKRHGLDIIKVIDNNGKMNENAGSFQGMDRYDARKGIVEEFERLGLLVKIEPYKHNVGTCQRCKTVVEPTVSTQWYVKMEPLAKPAIDVIRNGETKFIPERFSKIYFNWMENIQDWCISRQLWWGHRIPAYYCSCGHTIVSKTKPDKCPVCGGSDIHQDSDTLDTWFSSALWPFSTLGWPKETEDLKYFFPTDVLVTGYDIIFFWVARMIFSSCEQMGQTPFKYVFMHGLVRDAQGRKMSKSLGNGIDPLKIIDDYGTDALRFALIIGNAPGNDFRFTEEKVKSARNFANKIWNAFRFCAMNFNADIDLSKADMTKLNDADKWILSRVNRLAEDIQNNLDKFELGVALQKIYDFIWDEFCDQYIEFAKPALYNEDADGRTETLYVLNEVLCRAMKLLHPFMPFITEEIYMNLIHNDESIMISQWPHFEAKFDYPESEYKMKTIMDAIKAIRNIRAEMNVPMSVKAHMIFVSDNEINRTVLENGTSYFEKMAGAVSVKVQSDKSGIASDAVAVISSGCEIYIPLDDLIDSEKELQRLDKDKCNTEKEIARSEGKLSNDVFLSKAPAKVVEEEKAKLQKYIEQLDKINERIAFLNGRKK